MNVLIFKICKLPRQTRQECPHASPKRYFEGVFQIHFVPVNSSVFRQCPAPIARTLTLQKLQYPGVAAFVRANANNIFWIQMFEMAELAEKFIRFFGLDTNSRYRSCRRGSINALTKASSWLS